MRFIGQSIVNTAYRGRDNLDEMDLAKVPQVSLEKEKVIENDLRYFQMI